MIERKRKSETLQILFLLAMLGGLLTLSWYVYFNPAVLGLDVAEYGGPLTATLAGGKATLQTVRLYFANDRYDGLVPVDREVSERQGVAERAKQTLAELAAGPGAERTAPTVPRETKADAVYLIDDLLVVDLSKEIGQRLSGGVAQERMSLYSMVNSLCEIPGVRKVQFLLADQPIETLAGHLNLRAPLRPDPTLVETR